MLFFYINLDKDTHRHANMQNYLAKAGIQAERIAAVWWNDLPDAKQQALYSAALNQTQYYQALVPGEKGCYASHITAWRKLLESNAEFAIVLEDDVRLAPDFLAVVQAACQQHKAGGQGWDMLKLMGREVEKVAASTALSPGHALIQYRKIPSYTAGYIVHRQGAQKLLASRQPFGRPIDIDLRFFWENDLRIWGVQPAVVLLDESSQTTSIAQRGHQGSWRLRARKLGMKLRLLWGNWRHQRLAPWQS